MSSNASRWLHTRGRRTSLLAFFALMSGGCSATAPSTLASDMVGMYALASFDGKSLPAARTPVSCGATVTDGNLTISPRRYDVQPLYTLSVVGRPSCDTTTIAPEYVLQDAGSWDDTRPTPELISTAAAIEFRGREVAVVAAGHEFVFRFARALDARLHLLSLSALEGTRPIDGVFFEVTAADGIVTRHATAFGEPHLTGTVGGAVRIHVTAPTGWRLAEGQTNPTTYTVIPDQQLNVVVQLQRSSP